jgi:hypothetical protein
MERYKKKFVEKKELKESYGGAAQELFFAIANTNHGIMQNLSLSSPHVCTKTIGRSHEKFM